MNPLLGIVIVLNVIVCLGDLVVGNYWGALDAAFIAVALFWIDRLTEENRRLKRELRDHR